MFVESNPSPVKYAASLLKLSPEDVRLPLVKVTENTKKEVGFNLETLGIENTIVEEKDVSNFICSKKYVGGIFDKKIGSIHPAKLVLSMINMVRKNGGFIFN